MKKYKIKKLIIDCTHPETDGIQLIKIEYENGNIPIVSKSNLSRRANKRFKNAEEIDENYFDWTQISFKDILFKGDRNPLPILDIQVGDMILKCNNCDK